MVILVFILIDVSYSKNSNIPIINRNIPDNKNASKIWKL